MMKTLKYLQSVWMAGSFAMALAFLSATTSVRANVYATDIKVNGSLTSTNAPEGSSASITYRLNQAATAGVTVNILQGSTVVATFEGGTGMGLNTVSWTPANAGTFSVSITAGAVGFPIWTQISVDTNPGMPANYPLGIDVDKNTNSPYYGRVIMGCASVESNVGENTNIPAAAKMVGLYKMNADGTQADEGWYGNANYLEDDGSDPQVSGQMPGSGGLNPVIIRIGNDDRIYWCDDSAYGAIIACDMEATTNQIVIDDGPYSGLGGSNTYAGNPDIGDLKGGIQQFDVTGAATTSTALWLCDVDFPNWGVWMYHIKNGAADPADTEGSQAVMAGAGSDIARGSSGGCMIDTTLDIFVSQNSSNNASVLRTMEYTNWNHGVLPPEAKGSKYAYGTATGQVLWGVGTLDNTFCGVRDTVINSRTHPTMAALPMTAGSSNVAFGIRVLNIANGSVVSVTNTIGTNGATVQTLTNINYTEQYTCAAWDNVGNLYGASTTRNLWRVWSPPGTNQATTVAVAQVIVPLPFAITGITASPTTSDCAAVTISFTAPGNPAPSAFTLIGSATVNGTYKAVAGVSITGGSGAYRASFTNCSTKFYQIEE
jgi:hypothetical protein